MSRIFALLVALGLIVAACAPVPADATSGSIIYADGDRLLLVNPDGRAPAREVFHGRGKGTVLDPAVSPDGRQIAYTFTPVPAPTASFGADIYVVGTDGANPRAVFTHDVDGGLARAPAWSSDGTALYFAYSFSHKPAGQAQLMAVQQLLRLDLSSGARTVIATDADSPAVAPSGGRLAFIGVPADVPRVQPGAPPPALVPSLWLADGDGGNARPLVSDASFAILWSARFSPDGRQLVVTAAGGPRATPRLTLTLPRATGQGWPPPVAAHGFPLDLWLIDVETGKLELLAALAADDLIAAWSPDGKRLALQSGDGLFVLEVATGTVALVTPTAGFGPFDWAA